MDIANLLRAIVGEATGARQAPGASAAEPAGSAAGAFESLLAQAIDTNGVDLLGASGARPLEPGVQSDSSCALPVATLPVLHMPTELAQTLDIGDRQQGDDRPTSGARVLDLALLTALVTWVGHAIGARGSQEVTTVEGRRVESLTSDLPAVLRQAIEETLAALDRQGAAIPQGILTNLDAIRDAVTVAVPETVGRILPDATVRAYAEELAESVVKAVSERFDYGAGLIQTVLEALGDRQRTALVEPMVPDRLRAEQLMDLLANRTESGNPQIRDVVQALLAALHGAVSRVQPWPDSVQAGDVPSAQPPAVSPSHTYAAQARGTAEQLAAAAQSATSTTAQGAAPDEPDVAPAPRTRLASGVRPEAEALQQDAPRASVLATTPVGEIGRAPAFGTNSERLTAAIEGSLVQAPAGRPGVTVPEQTGIVEAAEAYARNGLGEARELLGVRRWVASPTSTVADDLLQAARGSPDQTQVGRVVLEATGGRREVLTGEGLARLLAVLRGEERVDAKAETMANRTEGANAARPSLIADAIAASVSQPTAGTPEGPRGSPDVRDVLAERVSSSIMDQIERGVHGIAQRGRHEVTIELKPPYLGDLQVTLRATDQAVTAHFQAQSHTVKALLESNMHVLRDMLQDAGLSADVLEVSVGFGGAGDGNAYRNPGEATRLYRILDPRHVALPVEVTARPLGERVGSVYGLASVVDILA